MSDQPPRKLRHNRSLFAMMQAEEEAKKTGAKPGGVAGPHPASRAAAGSLMAEPDREPKAKDKQAAAAPEGVHEKVTVPDPRLARPTVDFTEDQIVEEVDPEKDARFTQWKSWGASTEEKMDFLWNTLYDVLIELRGFRDRQEMMKDGLAYAFAEESAEKALEARMTKRMENTTDRKTQFNMADMYKWIREIKKHTQELSKHRATFKAWHAAWIRFEEEYVKPLKAELDRLRAQGQDEEKKGFLRRLFGK